MKRILVPIGTSKNVHSHIQYAIDMADDFGAKLYLVQFFNIQSKAGTLRKIDNIIKRESIEYIESLLTEVDRKDVKIVVKAFKGDLIDTLEVAADVWKIDMILLEPRTSSKSDQVWLGKTSGRIIKRTDIPALIVPEGYSYKPMKKILFALKNATLRKQETLEPLKDLKEHYHSEIDLLMVKTPFHQESDFDIPEEISSLVTTTSYSENATTFQGVLENFQRIQPDAICVVRRNRGAFSKLWEKNTILKVDFHSSVPVIVLSGLK